MRLRSAAQSDIGRHRSRNEDRCIVDTALGVFGVADGVGGLPGGGPAAQQAHDSVLAGFRAAVDDVTHIVQNANADVARLGRELSPATGIATTLTVGRFRAAEVMLAHVGDSRCYAWSRGRFGRVTRDHVEDRALTRCLGQREPLQVDLITLPLNAGDRYLFCTDGLTGMASDDEIGALAAQGKAPAAIVDDLIALALRRGGNDNVSTVLVIVDDLSGAP